jgi:cell division protein FtsB
MTFVGKVLVVAQVLFSILFMAFAGAVYSVQTSWKDKHDALAKKSAQQQTQLSTEVKQLKEENDVLVKSENAAKVQVDTLTAKVNGLTQAAVDLAAALKVEQDASIRDQAVSLRFTTEADVRSDEAVSQRTRNDALLDARGELVAEVQKLEDDLFNSEKEQAKLIEKHNRVLLEKKALETIVAANGLSTDLRDYLEKKPPPPVVQGLVLNTRRGKRSGMEFIEISLGSDDGLLEGHDLHIYRDKEAKYLGKITLIHVAPDQAVGTLVINAKNGSIQRGDNVKTKL